MVTGLPSFVQASNKILRNHMVNQILACAGSPYNEDLVNEFAAFAGERCLAATENPRKVSYTPYLRNTPSIIVGSLLRFKEYSLIQGYWSN